MTKEKVYCNVCDNPAKWYCADCKVDLCTVCMDEHCPATIKIAHEKEVEDDQ